MLQLDPAAPLPESAPTDWSDEDALLPQDVLDRSPISASQEHDDNTTDASEPWEGLSPVDAFAAHMAFEAWEKDVTSDAQSDADHAASLAWEADDTPALQAADLSPSATNYTDAFDYGGSSSSVDLGGAGTSTDVGAASVAQSSSYSESDASAATDAVGAD